MQLASTTAKVTRELLNMHDDHFDPFSLGSYTLTFKPPLQPTNEAEADEKSRFPTKQKRLKATP